jgi:hypothetical protein
MLATMASKHGGYGGCAREAWLPCLPVGCHHFWDGCHSWLPSRIERWLPLVASWLPFGCHDLCYRHFSSFRTIRVMPLATSLVLLERRFVLQWRFRRPRFFLLPVRGAQVIVAHDFVGVVP